MAQMNVELYNALRKAGAPDDSAELAAKSVAEAADFAAIRKDIGDIKADLSGVKGSLDLLKRVIGVGMPILLAILVILLNAVLTIAQKIPGPGPAS